MLYVLARQANILDSAHELSFMEADCPWVQLGLGDPLVY